MSKKPEHKTRIIGLTGNIASGKSAVAEILRDLGYPVVDADQVSREVIAPGTPGQQTLLNAFGTVDRAEIRKLVFNNADERKKLEAILHPLIQKRSHELFEELKRKGHSEIFYEASLLIEAGRAKDFDGLLVITTKPELQKTRLKTRDPAVSAEIAQQMIAAQMSQDEKRKYATWVIENNGTPEQLRAEVVSWIEKTL